VYHAPTQPSGELTVPTDINPGITDAELSRMYRHAYDGGQTDHHDVVNLIRQLVYRPTPPDTERCRHCEHGRRVHVVARGGQRDRCEMAGCECRAYEATPPNNTPGADSVDVEAVAREFAADWGMTHETAHDLADVLQAHGDAMYERGKREERERLLTEFDATGVCDDWVLDALRTKEGGKP